MGRLAPWRSSWWLRAMNSMRARWSPLTPQRQKPPLQESPDAISSTIPRQEQPLWRALPGLVRPAPWAGRNGRSRRQNAIGGPIPRSLGVPESQDASRRDSPARVASRTRWRNRADFPAQGHRLAQNLCDHSGRTERGDPTGSGKIVHPELDGFESVALGLDDEFCVDE